uniref:Major facilitator superfamily (MFS) profile domain-containing protein n=1 Tax=Lutzomyia longipalpis TaxID=7200 RepID=A0A1B0CI08_LUTLO
MGVETCDGEKKFLPNGDKNSSHNEPRDWRSSSKRQIFASFVANLTVLSSGMGLGYPATTLSLLTDPTSVVALTEDQGSWVASINTIFSPVGGLIASYTLDKFGRKKTLIAINILSIISWAIVAFSSRSDANVMYMEIIGARIIIGIVAGLSSSPSSVYSAEIAKPRLRGRLTVFTSISISSGVLIIYMLGYFINNDWRLVSGIAGIISVVALLSLYFVPESPRWLVMKNRDTQAEKSLKRLNGKECNCKEELQQLTEQIHGNHAGGGRSLTRWEMLQRPEFYKPVFIMMCFFTFQQLSGTFVLVVYAVKFSVTAGVTLDPFLFTVLLGIARVLGTAIVGFLLDVLGRRQPAIIGGLGMGISLFGVVLCMWNPCPATKWIAAFLIFFYVFTSTVSFLVIPFAMIAEVYPQRMRGFASGITVSYAYVLCFLAIKIYPTLVTLIGSDYICLMYGTVAFLEVKESQSKESQEIINMVDEEVDAESFEEVDPDTKIYEMIAKRYMFDIPIVRRISKEPPPPKARKVEEKPKEIPTNPFEETQEEEQEKQSHQDEEVQTQEVYQLTEIIAGYQRRIDILICLNVISSGMSIAFPGLFFEQFYNPGRSEKEEFSKKEASWIASVNVLMVIVGVALTRHFLKRMGNKKSFIMIGTLNIISWIILGLSGYYYCHLIAIVQMLLARILQGITGGFTFIMAIIFESEIAFTNIRGVLTVLPTVSFNVGIILVNLFGIGFPNNWEIVCFICSLVCLIITIATIFVPETQSFSTAKKTGSDSQVFLDEPHKKVPKEMIYLKNLEQMISQYRKKSPLHDDFRDFWANFRKKHLLRPLIILFGINFFFHFSGFYIICIYTAYILHAMQVQQHVTLLILCVNFSRLAGVAMALICFLKIKRTLTFKLSGIGMIISLVGLVLLSFFPAMKIISVIFLIIYVFFNSLGFTILVCVLVPEIIPKIFRTTILTIIVVFSSIVGFCLIVSFPHKSVDVGIHFLFYAVLNFIAIIFVHLAVPETYKKSYEQIQAQFHPKNHHLHHPHLQHHEELQKQTEGSAATTATPRAASGS